MNIFQYRPLCLVTVCFVLTGFLCLYLPLVWKIILGGILLVTSILFFFPKIRRHLPGALSVITLFCMLQCMLSCLSFDLPLYRVKDYDGKTLTTSACVTDICYDGTSYFLYEIKTETIDNKTQGVAFLLSTSEKMELGQTFTADLNIHTFSARSFDENLYSMANGFVGEAEIASAIEYGNVTNSPLIFARKCRDAISDYLNSAFHKDTAALLRAMLLGDRNGLSGQTSLSFRRTGLTHLLALSGMHITVMIIALKRLLGLFRVPKRTIAPITLVFITLYSFLVGMPLSIMRAAGMSAVLLIGTMIRRERDALSSLAFSALIILLISPRAILDLGFWLSVTATLGILLCTEYNLIRIENRGIWRRCLRFLLTSLVMTLAASFLTLPIIAFFFGEISLLSIPANLIFSPLMTPLIYLDILSIPIVFLRPIANFTSEVYLKLLADFSRPGGIMMSLEGIFFRIFMLLAVAYLFFFLVAKLRHPKRMLIPFYCLITFMIIAALIPHIATRQQVSLTYADDIGGNDYILLQDEGTNVLYISSYFSTYYLPELFDTLHRMGVSEIDLLCFSHYHNSPAPYIDKLSSRILIHEVAFPTPYEAQEEAYWRDASVAADKANIPVTLFSWETPLTVDQIKISPQPRSVTKESGAHARVAATFTIGEKTFYYASAGYYHALPPTQVLPDLAALSCDILIFGQHGTDSERKLPHVYPIDEHVVHIYYTTEDARMAFVNPKEEALYQTIATGHIDGFQTIPID